MNFNMLSVSPHLRHLKDVFSEVIIVGAGPTQFDYNEFSNIHEPIFFINRTHKFSENCPSEHQYFFTHHITEFEDVQPITIYIEKMYYDLHDYRGFLMAQGEPKNRHIRLDVQAAEEVIDEEFLETHSWLLDKEEVSNRNRLMSGFGSVTTVFHMAWFVGAKKVTMIGCNPELPTNAHDDRLIKMGLSPHKKMIYGGDKIKENTRVLPVLLGLNVEHV